MFRLEHHRRIASLLEQLNGELLLRHHCLFGRKGWLERCRQALAIEAPRAALLQRLLNLQKLAGGPAAPAPD